MIMLNPLTSIKDYTLIGAVVALLAFGGVQSYRLNSAEKTLAESSLARVLEDAERERLARADEDQTDKIEAVHTAKQIEKEQEFNAKTKVLEEQRRIAVDNAKWLQFYYTQYAARTDPKAGSDGATCSFYKDRLEKLATLAAEGGQLLGEGKLLIIERDEQVEYLKDMVLNDRTLTSPEK